MSVVWVGGIRDFRNWRNPQHCFSFVCIVMASAFKWIVYEDCLLFFAPRCDILMFKKSFNHMPIGQGS
jgi:hypothetical protein